MLRLFAFPMKSIHERSIEHLIVLSTRSQFVQTYFEEEHNEKYNDRSLFNIVNANSRSEIRSQREIHVRNAKRSQLRNVRSVTMVPWDLFETTRRLCESRRETSVWSGERRKRQNKGDCFCLWTCYRRGENDWLICHFNDIIKIIDNSLQYSVCLLLLLVAVVIICDSLVASLWLFIEVIWNACKR